MDEKISKLFLPVLEKLYNTEPAGEPFRKPVDVVKYGCFDYYLYVKHPIDLSTIKERLVSNQYKDAWRFVADIQLMFSNAYLFNKKGTPVYEFTNKLSKIWNLEVNTVMTKLKYCCGHLHKFGPQLLFCHGTTVDRYCQIAIGAKYKCYQDQYSFCLPCFNKIDSDQVTIQNLSCETARMKLPTHPLKKSQFADQTNDQWQYETFLQCTQCTRRVHQICSLYPADEDEIESCIQHAQLEEEQKQLCKVPEEYRTPSPINISSSSAASSSVACSSFTSDEVKVVSVVDNIAARLSINKQITAEQTQLADQLKNSTQPSISRDKFVCNHCYRKKDVGFNLRHRKYSARRLPHTRMSIYIETKVNEYIRENSPAAGEVTIRVLTAYRDTNVVKPEMKKYVRKSRTKCFTQPTNIQDYPDEFAFTTRAIFAWQEIDGVDVCVFGMHVQEYGEDCPEPNKQVVYLSYLDSVHFFRPKQFRTAVYHEILLSYFKYVKKLGFRKVFIWVCPSRKGDDYIFYRHPSEQKMPTLRRLSDWYINLLDKGIMAGIVEKHSNIYQYADSQNWTSILSMPYLSGDYWPSEFERLLKIMIESQKEYELKLSHQNQINQNDFDDFDTLGLRQQIEQRIEELGQETTSTNSKTNIDDLFSEQRHDTSLFGGFFQRNQSLQDKAFNLKPIGSGNSRHRHLGSNPNFYYNSQGDFSNILLQDTRSPLDYNVDSSRSDSDQPLDLSKASSNASPESFFDDDMMSELSFSSSNANNRKRRRKSNNMSGYSKKRKGSSSAQTARASSRNNNWDFSRSSYRKHTSTQSHRDSITSDTPLDPEAELMKNLARSLKRQKDGFIVARLNDCDCSPHFESQRRKEEAIFTCDLMRGREPFLQLARLKNYEFSSLRRAKFSSLAMVKHLSNYFKLDPICNQCLSFDSSKRHYVCSLCIDYYLCTSCHENAHHDHPMALMAPTTQPDIDEFLQDCSLASATNSISSASSTISNKSFNEINPIDNLLQSIKPTSRKSAFSTVPTSTPLTRHISNTPYSSETMPLSCQRQRNRGHGIYDKSESKTGDEENAKICLFDTGTKLSLPNQSPTPSHASSDICSINDAQFELDNVLVENFMRHAEISYDIDFALMQNESKKVLSHYWSCPIRDSCAKCKFVVLSCSFMNALMRSSRLQMMINCNPSEIMPDNTSSTNHLSSGINLTTAHRLSYQPKTDK